MSSDPPSGPLHARAYAFATTFRLRELQPVLNALRPGTELSLLKDELWARFADGSTAIVFDFGAVTFFGGEELRDQVVAALAATSRSELHPPLTDDLIVEVDPTRALDVRFDRVLVPALSPSVMGVVGLLLAQSAAMDYYDEDVGDILSRTSEITRGLTGPGRMGGKVKDLIRFIGSCIHTRNGVIETLALFDKPDVTWEEESTDKLFMRLREVLELDDRFRTFEYKLRMIQDNLVLLVDLSRQRHTIFLETAVLFLILFEVVVMVWQVARGH